MANQTKIYQRSKFPSCHTAQTNSQMHRQSDAQTVRCTDSQMHRQSDAQTVRCTDSQMHRQSDAQTVRCTDSQMHRQSDAQTVRCDTSYPLNDVRGMKMRQMYIAL